MRSLLRAAACLALASCAGAVPAPLAVADASASDEMRARPAGPGAALRLFATGDTRGFLVPCGCEADQRGGIARRKGYLDAVARPGDLRIDVGNAAAGTGAARRLRMESTFRALEAMDYAAFVPGRWEVLARDDFAAARAAAPGLPFVCANLVDPAGRPVLPAFVESTLPDGRVAAIVGVTEEVEPSGPSRSTTDAAGAAWTAIASLRGRADVVVVAAAMPWRDARDLADSLDGVALVVGGIEDRDGDGPPAGAKAPLVATGPRGEHVLRVDFDAALRPAAAWRAWLGEGLPEDAAMADLVRRHRSALSDLDPGYVPDVLAGLAAREFAGSETCADCHAEDHGVWARSGHAHAMATLVAEEAARDPECVPCHLADVPAADGTQHAPEGLGVGCEACHGGSRGHVESARAGKIPPEPTPFRAERGDCRGCHRPPEVTRFDAEAAWKEIDHGRR